MARGWWRGWAGPSRCCGFTWKRIARKRRRSWRTKRRNGFCKVEQREKLERLEKREWREALGRGREDLARERRESPRLARRGREELAFAGHAGDWRGGEVFRFR